MLFKEKIFKKIIKSLVFYMNFENWKYGIGNVNMFFLYVFICYFIIIYYDLFVYFNVF